MFLYIEKADPKSKVLGELITAKLDHSQFQSYLELLRKTWPKTVVKVVK